MPYDLCNLLYFKTCGVSVVFCQLTYTKNYIRKFKNIYHSQQLFQSPYGEATEPEKAPEAISKAVASLPPEQMFELMKQMKVRNRVHIELTLTLKAPIASKVVCFSRLLKCLRSLYNKQCGPRSDCSYRSSLIWVHPVCFYT